MAAYKQTDRHTHTQINKQTNKHHTKHFINNLFSLLVPDGKSPLSM